MKQVYTPEETLKMWNDLIEYIDIYISSPRKEKLLSFYEKYQERIMFAPASHRKEYHNTHVSGYLDHVLRVINASLKLYHVWGEFEADMSTFTVEELVFSALNHDLGKMGDEQHEAYIPQTDQWRKDKLGEDYTFNTQLPFASVPDRGLFLLQSYGIPYTFNEMIAIQTHDGLYDEGNKKYLLNFPPEQKPRTCLPYILHQADLLAARVEFEREWLPKFKEKKQDNLEISKKNYTLTGKTNKTNIKPKALSSLSSAGLKNMLDDL
jgi:hypothetical protein